MLRATMRLQLTKTLIAQTSNALAFNVSSRISAEQQQQSVVDKTKEMLSHDAEATKDKFHDATEKTKDLLHDAKEKTQEFVESDINAKNNLSKKSQSFDNVSGKAHQIAGNELAENKLNSTKDNFSRKPSNMAEKAANQFENAKNSLSRKSQSAGLDDVSRKEHQTAIGKRKICGAFTASILV